jgi:ubiquinone/menaquinone biosynthesis C-methylase UbiE
MQDYCAARALEYDQVYLKPERQADLRQMEAWVSECFAGHYVLELACGTGHWTRFIAQTASQLLGAELLDLRS